jgi:hypothetical protein
MAANTDAQWNAMTKIANDFFKRNDCGKLPCGYLLPTRALLCQLEAHP